MNVRSLLSILTVETCNFTSVPLFSFYLLFFIILLFTKISDQWTLKNLWLSMNVSEVRVFRENFRIKFIETGMKEGTLGREYLQGAIL